VMERLGRESLVLELCVRRGWKLAVAESCTGGLIGARLTSVPGSSACFEGGVIAYSNNLKMSLLAVPMGLIESEGAVSGLVAEAMAMGGAAAAMADCGIAVTGVAGPDGGTDEKPVGTVWVAVALPTGTTSRQYHFRGTRDEVREQAVNAALALFLETAENIKA
jgi:PncC family amidohydrolase